MISKGTGLRDPDDSPTLSELCKREDSGIDSVRCSFAVAAFICLVLIILGESLPESSLLAAGIFLYAFLGFGSGGLQVFRAVKGYEFIALSLGLSMGIVVLLGFALAEIHVWSLAKPLFFLLVALSALGHASLIVRDRSCLPKRRELLDFVSSHYRSHLVGSIATVGAALCLLGAVSIRDLDPGSGGLLGALPWFWYLGLAAIVTTVVLEFTRSSRGLGYSVILLNAVLTCTSIIVFADPLYSWTAKQVGITTYIIDHGRVNSSIDIFQAWPGFFAGVAWLSTVAHVVSPLAEARWWPAVVDLGILLIFRQLAERFSMPSRNAWLAATFFCVGNVVGQNYFSPQSAAYFLALVIFTVSLGRRVDTGKVTGLEWTVLIICSLGIAVTHQLTPYMVIGAVVALALFGFLRSRLIIVVVLVPALVWGAINERYVREFVNPDQFGDISGNLAPPGHLYPTFHKDLAIHLSVIGQVVGLLPICLLAGFVLVLRRDRRSLLLAVCAATGCGLIVVSSYGQEGILRVVLFALPWLSLLGASGVDSHVRRTFVAATCVVVPVAVIGFLFAIMGLDYYYAMRPSDVAAVRYFENTARPGSVMFTVGNSYMPVELTGRYNEFYRYDFPDLNLAGDRDGKFQVSKAVSVFTTEVDDAAKAGPPGTSFYVLAGEQPEAQLASVGLASRSEYQSFTLALVRSPKWHELFAMGDSALFLFVQS